MNIFQPLVALIAVVAVMTGQPAKADVQYIGGAGYWSSFMGSAVDGTSLCGMMTTIPSARSSLMVRWFGGKDFFEVKVSKAGWQIPADSSTPVVVSFDGSEWPVTAYANDADPDHGSIIWMVPHDQVRSFAHVFTSSNVMTVIFKQGTEAPWTLGLNGTSSMLNKFSACVLAVGSGDAENPFAYMRVTQPFGASPVPTQPMAVSTKRPNA